MVGESEKALQTPWEAVAAQLEADREHVLQAYLAHLERMASPLVVQDVARRQILTNCDQIITDVIDSVQAGEVRVDQKSMRLARTIGESRAARGMHPRESLQAAWVLYEFVIAALIPHLQPHEEALEILEVAVLALNRSLTTRIQEAATSYTGYLLDQVHEAHVEERHRLARDLHDRVGQGLSVVHRQLELYELNRTTEPARAPTSIATAQRALHEITINLRSLASELRLDQPVADLEQALLSYVDTAPINGGTIHLGVSGDATWFPSTVQEESFLILREAIENALVHGHPESVIVRVDLAPHELRAWVEDDGCGFDPDQPSSGIGLCSMRERAAQMGGTVQVSSRPASGAVVELVVPRWGPGADD